MDSWTVRRQRSGDRALRKKGAATTLTPPADESPGAGWKKKMPGYGSASAKRKGEDEKRAEDDSSSSSSSTDQRRRSDRYARPLILLTHALTLLLYLYPLTRRHEYNPALLTAPRPVLDESHIMSEENKDVRGTAPLRELWRNDYWGRPMDSPSSHKSWRPLTVLSFRWLKLGGSWGWAELFSHRVVNVVIHSTVAELASILSIKLFFFVPSSSSLAAARDNNNSARYGYDRHKLLLTRLLVKLLFALHPSHVECTANAANRPHILSLLFSALACDPDVHILIMAVCVACGLLCSETAVFQLPAVAVTMTAIRWRQQSFESKSESESEPEPEPGSKGGDGVGNCGEGEGEGTGGGEGAGPSALVSAFISLLPRYLTVIALGLAYLGGRHSYDTLSIPDGLIRPAENPYYSLEGVERASTYSLVLSAHVGKAFGVDPVGFSHEYGFDCVRKVSSVSPLGDPRLWIPVGLLLACVVITCECLVAGLEACVMWSVMAGWLITLFPVSGLVKVGTSIADRIAVPSSLAAAIFGGRWLAWYVGEFGNGWFGGGARWSSSAADARRRAKLSRPLKEWTIVKSASVLILFVALWRRVDRRASQWMDSVPLLESSLVSCPRSAKSNLEISKIYSGLYPDKFDLERALSYLKKAEQIDPTYCDVHQQYAHCLIQQQRYLEFEEHLTEAVMCPFSMGGAVHMWRQYWQAVTADPRTGEAAKRRMDRYQGRINEAVQREAEKEEKLEAAKKREKMKRPGMGKIPDKEL